MAQSLKSVPIVTHAGIDALRASTVNCLILAGGGAKGAYGAGAAKALFAYHKMQQELGLAVIPEYCFFGTSAGALNACILAASGPDQLVNFWSEASKSSVLGTWASRRNWLHLPMVATNPLTYWRVLSRGFTGKPPSFLYNNRALRKLITRRLKEVDWATLQERHLVICATNYSVGKMVAFYISNLIDGFKTTDDQLEPAKRRIGHFVKITDMDMLIDVLLASTAIPLVFPPVKIGENWYVDGGIGNNIPIRETAYFLRHLNKHQAERYRVGDVYCVTLDEPGKVSSQHRFGVTDILWRTYDVFEYVHMRPIVDAWSRINKEVAEYANKMQEFQLNLAQLQLPPATLQQVSAIALQTFGQMGGATSRLDVPLHLIEPGGPIGDLLRFDSTVLKQHISRGYKEAAQSFLTKGFVDTPQHNLLLDRIQNPIA